MGYGWVMDGVWMVYGWMDGLLFDAFFSSYNIYHIIYIPNINYCLLLYIPSFWFNCRNSSSRQKPLELCISLTKDVSNQASTPTTHNS